MKTLTFVLLAVFAAWLSLSGTVSVATAAPPSPFIGTWETTDFDGSSMLLTITPLQGDFRINWLDHAASACGVEDGVILYAWRGEGTGAAIGYVLRGRVEGWCYTHPPTFWGEMRIYYTYDADTDTIIDTSYVSGSLTWHRVGEH